MASGQASEFCAEQICMFIQIQMVFQIIQIHVHSDSDLHAHCVKDKSTTETVMHDTMITRQKV